MKIYRVKYFYFSVGAKGEHGYTIVKTDSSDEEVIVSIAKEQGFRETGKVVSVSTIEEM